MMRWSSRMTALASLAVCVVGGPIMGQETAARLTRVPGTPGEAAAVLVSGAPLVHTAQLLPSDARGQLVGAGDLPAQIRQVLTNLELVLATSQASLTDLVKLNFYVTDDNVAAAVRAELARRWPEEAPATCFVVTRLPLPGAEVALDAVACSRESWPPATSPRRRAAGVATTSPGEHAVICPPAGRVYVAGQAEKGNLREATRRTLGSLEATLRFLQLEWSDVGQLKSFVTPLAEVAEAEAEVRAFFGERPIPPLVWVEWESSLPIEIELVAGARSSPAVAAASTDTRDLEFLTPPGMTTPTIYSRVTRMPGSQTIYVSGLYGEPGRDGAAQVEQIFARLRTILERLDSDLTHLVKATYYVVDNDASVRLNELRPRYYDPRRPPAASKAQVRGVGRTGTTITLDMIAVPAR